MVLSIADAPVRTLNPVTAYEILRLRIDVFVVEQRCLYPEADGRDLEPDCRWVWAQDDGQVVATLRILRDDDAFRIGRVATAVTHRGRRIADQLMRHALALCDGPVVLDAQTYLRDWYARLGFSVCGPQFVEDGIAHVPMRLSEY